MKEKCREEKCREDGVLFVHHQDSLSFSPAPDFSCEYQVGVRRKQLTVSAVSAVSEGLRGESPYLVFKNLLILYLLASNPLWWWKLFLLCFAKVHYSIHIVSPHRGSLIWYLVHLVVL